MTVYLSSAYLAPVEYYTKLLAYDQIYIEQHDHYTKQTYQNWHHARRVFDGATCPFHSYSQTRHTEMPDA